MIIKKNDVQKKESKQSQNTGSTPKASSKKNVIKKEDLILDTQKAVNTSETSKSQPPVKKAPEQPKQPQKQEEEKEEKPKPKPQEDFEEFEKIDITSIEFKERVERRRGDRRRGYRRIDERSLVSRAQQEAHSIKELASKEGYKNGLEKAGEEINEIKEKLNEFLNSRQDMYDEFYPHIMELSLEIAKKIINKEVEMSNDVLKNVIMSVLDEMNSDAEKVTIKVNPSDVEFANASLPEIIETKKLDVKVNVSSDETVEKGSCIVIANNGVVDANFKTQLAVLQNAFGIYKGGI